MPHDVCFTDGMVWGPLPFTVSSWEDGVNLLHLGQHSTGAQPLIVQMNDL